MDIKVLQSKWEELTGAYTNSKMISSESFEELVHCYSSKNRTYHTLKHISNLLESAHQFKSKLHDYDLVCFSIWFHDVVYNATSTKNEELSAEFAEDHLIKLLVPEVKIKRIQYLILATKNHQNVPLDDTTTDLAYFLDFDLKILGSNEKEYEEYSGQVRNEYKIVPDFLYRPGRKKVLLRFLEAERLYKTEEFYQLFEKQARRNIQSEIERL